MCCRTHSFVGARSLERDGGGAPPPICPDWRGLGMQCVLYKFPPIRTEPAPTSKTPTTQPLEPLLVRRNCLADFVLARARELVDLRALFVELEGRHRLDAARRGNLLKLIDVDLDKDDVRHLLG